MAYIKKGSKVYGISFGITRNMMITGGLGYVNSYKYIQKTICL